MTRQQLLSQIAREAAKLGIHEGLRLSESVYHLLSIEEIDELRNTIKSLCNMNYRR